MSPEQAEAIVGPVREASLRPGTARPSPISISHPMCGSRSATISRLAETRSGPISRSISAAWARALRISTTIWQSVWATRRRLKDPGPLSRRAAQEAEAAVPEALIDETSLVGPKERVRDRLQAWREVAEDHRVGSLVLAGADIAALRTVAEAVL